MAPSVWRCSCYIVALIGFAAMLMSVEGRGKSDIQVNLTQQMEIVVKTGAILCSFHTKTIYVYFENQTSRGYSGEVLRQLTDCGLSYITMRNRVIASPLEAIKDDGILMFLLIIIHDASEELDVGTILQKKSAAKHLSFVLMIIEDPSTVTRHWLRNTFKRFWRIWLLNIVIMFWRREQLQVYRYNPFTDEYLINVKYLSPLPRMQDLFPRRLPNMQGKPLRICMYEDDIRAIFKPDGSVIGSDGLMSAYIAERLNATRIINQVSPFGNFMLKSDICFREMASAIDDIALNIRFLAIPNFRRQVESTVVHTRDDLCVLVPKAKTASTFWNLFRSFEAPVWVPIILSVPLAYWFCAMLSRRLYLLQLFASTLSLPFTQLPTLAALRIFVFFWLLYGMLIGNAYKGNLTSNLVFRTYLPDINTITDLADSSYDLLTYSRHVKHLDRFLNISNPLEARIRRKLYVLPDEELQARLNENNLSYAYLQKYHVAVLQVNSRRHSRYGRPLFHVMSDCLVPFHAVFIVPYGSPYLGFINRLIRSSHEFGFALHWEQQMSAVLNTRGKKANVRNQDDPVVLKLSHFKAAFCLLFVGHTIALLTFLWEAMAKPEGY